MNREEVKGNEGLIEEVTRECQDFLNDQKAFEVAYAAEAEDLIRQRAQLIQLQEQFKNSKHANQNSYRTFVQELDQQQFKIKQHFESTKDLGKQVIANVRKAIKKARKKFESPTSSESPKNIALKEYFTYQSDHPGVKDQVLPANRVFSYEN